MLNRLSPTPSVLQKLWRRCLSFFAELANFLEMRGRTTREFRAAFFALVRNIILILTGVAT
jgi:hypothetical protein